jgi:DNA-binding transcriptional ArsR family regulator
MNVPLRPELCAAKLRALAAPERLRIVRFLAAGPRNVTQIADMLRTNGAKVAFHTAVLRRAGLVRSRRAGRFIFYSLGPNVLQPGRSRGRRFINLGCCRLDVPTGPAL